VIWPFGQSSRPFFGSSVRWQSWYRWEDNIKIDVLEARWGGMDWIDLALDRVR